MLNLVFAQHAIACVLCELLCLELFTVFFQHENRFRYKFFDIVQFSRSCWRLSRPADDLISLPQKRFFVKLFFQKLLNFLNLDVSKSLKSLWDFLTSIGSFQGLLAEALEVILLPQRLALIYSTTFKRLWQVFFTSFFVFLVICIQRTVFLPVITSFLTGIFLIINIGLQARFCSAPEPLFRP